MSSTIPGFRKRFQSKNKVLASFDLVENSIPEIFNQEEDTSGSGSRIVGEKETEMEAEVLRYIADWIANKHSETHPNLGLRTETEETDHSSYCLVSWIRSLSCDGLIELTSKWLDFEKEMKKRCCSYHGPEVRKGVGVMKNLFFFLICASDPSVSSDLVTTFVKATSYIQIERLSQEYRKEENEQLRTQFYSLLALAFVLEDDILEAFDLLIENVDDLLSDEVAVIDRDIERLQSGFSLAKKKRKCLRVAQIGGRLD
ncbi:hypothetical protein ANN_18991 [Periplaneta americana]|uniref:Uncharacterized protein n=1 Tax=Periplaneta americana TaxID=6978 RepID=A0ABQ8SQ92_PERAM|nr:hypothetical protein ANN_18991 [Periplaneta americana]